MIDTEISKQFDRRSALFLTTGMVLTSALVLRMLQMQIFGYRGYKKKSENNSFRIQINMPERGKILSRSGSIISHDAPIYRIYIIPEETDNLENLVDVVATDLRLSKKRVDKIWARIKKQQKFQPVLISENADGDTLARVQAKNLAGLHVQAGMVVYTNWGRQGHSFLVMLVHPKNRLQMHLSIPQA